MTRKLTVFAAAAGMLVLGALSACRTGSWQGAPMVVLGFDGMDYGLTRRFMDEGRMPNLLRLEKEGTFRALGTAVPPQSPVAWSNFISGGDSSVHGLFDFLHRNPENAIPYFSMSRDEEPKKLKIAKWEIPLWGGGVKLLRKGPAFWEALEEQGVETHIYRMPANYPPSGTATRELSGMGTPDIRGTPGTFTFYTSDIFVNERTVDGGQIQALDLWNGEAEGHLRGPADLETPFSVFLDPEEPWVRLVVGEEERILTVGEWSDWVPVEFEMGVMSSLRGMARFYVRQTEPELELYASPINIDPLKPAKPLSTPESYAQKLASETGRFYTQGMPEDTKALVAEVFSYEEYLAQSKVTGDEITQQFEYVLDRFDGNFLFYYFGNLDQISHMMMRTMDPDHPAYDPEVDGRFADTIPNLYREFDDLVGYTLDRMPEGAKLVVMSDHGFASWRRQFHLNRWLVDNAYLTLKNPSKKSPSILGDTDWSKTRAYGLGLNGLYINLEGREKNGIVPPAGYDALLEELSAALLATVDPSTGEPGVTKVYKRDEFYGPGEHRELGPDLQVGYAKGVRCSGGSALGDVADEVFEDNTSAWSGDHCMDHDTVPGILASNFLLTRPAANLSQLTASILAEFDIE